jgi:hypothetical protein
MTPMRRRRAVVLLTALVLVLVAAALVALPGVARRVAIHQIRAVTGREVAIGDLSLNLFTRRLTVSRFRLADRTGPAPLAEFERLDARFRLRPLLRGRLYLDALALERPVVRIVRTGPDEFNISDLVERYLASPRQEPITFTLERFALTDGAVVLEDREIRPARRWSAKGVTVDARDVSTVADAERGTVAASLTLAGAPVSFFADQVRLRPAHARARLTVAGLDLNAVGIYVPPDAALRPERGRFSTRLEIEYDARDGARAGGDATVTDLALKRRGQAEPFVLTPSLRMTSRDVVWKDGVVTAGRLELAGDPTIVDASVTPAQRFDLRAARVVIEGAGYPARAPARVTLGADLPGGGRLEARGTAGLPTVADLQVTLGRIDPARLRPYLPAASPVTIARGRLDATLRVQRDPATDLRVNGAATIADGVLLRRGQSEPFVTHPLLRLAVRDLALRGRQLAIARLELAGTPTIVDGSVSPPPRFTLAPLRLVAEDATWPARGPARVDVAAGLAGGASARIRGVLNPATLATDVRAELRDVDLTRLRGYLPRDSAVTLDRGTLTGTLRLVNDRATGTRIGGDGTLADFALARGGDGEPFVSAPKLAVSVQDLVVRDGVSIGRVAAAGDTTVVDSSLSPPVRLLLGVLQIVAERLGWPGRGPAPVTLTAALPGAGTVSASGTVETAARRADLRVSVQDAAVTPYRRYLPVSGPIRGRTTADLRVAASFGEGFQLRVTGDARAAGLSLGAVEEPPIRLESVTATGIDMAWPARRIGIGRVVLGSPAALVERDKDGGFPLTTMLKSPQQDGERGQPGGEPGPRTIFLIRELVAENGDLRFVDRASLPVYSEEMLRMTVSVAGLTNAPGERARVRLQGVVGPHGALDLSGEIAPFDDPFFLDLAGELSEFPVPRVNPYMQRVLNWVAQTGTLTTRLHYRVVGDRLEASNEIVVRGLTVGRPEKEVGQRVGLPLGLAVSLLKDTRGDIHLSLPVSGTIGAPEFSFGGVVSTALRNLVTKAVTAPFRALGKIFRRGEEIEMVRIDPVEFEPGTTAVTPAAQAQLERVARFLRESPHVRLELEPVVTARDVLALKTQDVVARIQAIEREHRFDDFRKAATRLFKKQFPRQKVPADTSAIVARLRDHAPEPAEAARRLAARRVEAIRGALASAAGILGDRLAAAPESVGVSGPPRVEFELGS